MRQIMLSYSRDGGETWSNWKYRDIGKLGQYARKVKFGPLGASGKFRFRIRVTDPVRVDIVAAGATVEVRE